ncbi:MAG TPA: lytic transglycosylase domain-containing protein, partial [Burkholderiales bacterium]|nr:lytic transglycosylase domain-containing protein [Burkholderiales bacterium]
MIRRVRKTGMLLVSLIMAMIATGCAQTSGTLLEGDGTDSMLASSARQWPTPTMNHSPAPTPPEPTFLPQATIPANQTVEPQAMAEPPRRGVTPRRTAAVPRAPTITPAAASAPATASAPREPEDVWQRVRNGFQMRGTGDPSLVSDWENYYASRADYFARMIDNSGHFLYHIANEVEKRGMPLEIALLPMIESAYNPAAYSSAHASGIWQFIPSTGKNYGLKQNWWYDGRRDVIAATGAALDYLQALYGMFNDWELALAAYNWGEGA